LGLKYPIVVSRPYR